MKPNPFPRRDFLRALSLATGASALGMRASGAQGAARANSLHLASNIKPHLALEVAVEKGTPHTLTPVEAHRRSLEYARRVFADFAG